MRGPFLVAKVAVSCASYSFDCEYSYLVPDEMRDKIRPGMRVLVPFGRGNKRQIGFVTRTYMWSEFNDALKPMVRIIDDEPLVNDEQLRLIFWLKENTFCTFFEGYKTIVPTGFNYIYSKHYTLVNAQLPEDLTEYEEKSIAYISNCRNQREIDEFLDASANDDKKKLVKSLVDKGCLEEFDALKRKVGDNTIKMLKLSNSYLEGKPLPKITQRQMLVIKLLEDCGSASVQEICYMTSGTPTLINRLVKNGVIDEFGCEVMRNAIGEINQRKSADDIVLNDKQQEAYDGISQLLDSQKPAGCLLFGVTGSGKTSVFIRLIHRTVEQGKSAIMLVPEISLTPQMVGQFKTLFGETVAVIHSALSQGQRMDEYKRISRGEAKIVIGTRSAVFSPVINLGLIIMDEEGEHTYKSEASPRYHARDIAIQRCGYNKSVLLMASATPSLESYYFAQKKRYSFFELTHRYSNAVLPEVRIVDMQRECEQGNDGVFSRELAKRISENIDNHEQTILLLNRRGFSTIVSCMDCRKPVECPNCSLPLTYHKKNNRLMCHYCGYSMQNVTECPECHSTKLRMGGHGTQRIEDELSQLFPDGRILRMDADTTNSRYAYEEKFDAFKRGEYDILLGTQMIAKGLDFPNVTCVGVVSLDKALFAGDFRSYERTFSLITQVVGRSGRGDKPGVAFIQTFVPDHYVINLASQQDYKEFYEQEIALRQVLIYPPYCDVCTLGFSSQLESKTINATKYFLEILQGQLKNNSEIKFLRVLGPVPCTLGRVNNKYRYRIILKCKNNKPFRNMISNLLTDFLKNRDYFDVRIYADINGDIGL